VSKFQLSQKLDSMQKESVDQEEQGKLILYVKKYLTVICDKFISKQILESDTIVESLIDLLSFIVSKFKVDDFLKKVTHEFLQFKEEIVNNVELNLLLMKNGILSI
jgi:hypothetical protein